MIPVISIIIPIYNTEEYVLRCLKSALNTSEQNIEIICIDDGSADRSGKICDEVQNQDQRLRVYHQKNKGVSSARNLGIEKALGRWIMFADSDDILLPEYYKLITELDEDYDLVIFDYIEEGQAIEENLNTNGRDIGHKDVAGLIRKNLMSKTIEVGSKASLRSSCAKAYRREFLLTCNIRFPDEIKIGEDMLFNLSVFMKVKRAKYIPVAIYQVTCRDGSAMHSYVDDMIEHDILFQKKLYELLLENNRFEENRDLYYSEVKSGILRCLRKKIFFKGNRKKRKEVKSYLEEILNNNIYREALKVHDFNCRRNIVLCLVKHRCVGVLGIVMKIMG